MAAIKIGFWLAAALVLAVAAVLAEAAVWGAIFYAVRS